MKTYGHNAKNKSHGNQICYHDHAESEEKKLAYGKFSLGRDKTSSMEIFGLLKGKSEPVHPCFIQMELSQDIAGLPVPIGMIYCSLEELKENIAVISREIFRIAQLEDGDIIPLQ
ncbi:hypothetical protein [Pedobacter jeongneungensis]|uniref:hypothetical protein n=1 Tax=Pedobacter jeongneungensis TaxID=947309 RepID=UPI00046AB6C1|nr:hypothetical protein [Pedobacter jeongneungensis]